jgi:hypothetical protein
MYSRTCVTSVVDYYVSDPFCARARHRALELVNPHVVQPLAYDPTWPRR